MLRVYNWQEFVSFDADLKLKEYSDWLKERALSE